MPVDERQVGQIAEPPHRNGHIGNQQRINERRHAVNAISSGDDRNLFGTDLLSAADEVTDRADPRLNLRPRRGIRADHDRSLRYCRAGTAERFARFRMQFRVRSVRYDVPERGARQRIVGDLLAAPPELCEIFLDCVWIDGDVCMQCFQTHGRLHLRPSRSIS